MTKTKIRTGVRGGALALLACALLPGGPAAADDALDGAVAVLQSADPAERVRALGMIEDCGKSAKAESAVLKALPDSDWGVQIRAANALSKVGGKASVAPLAKVAVDGEIQWVRDAAVAALRIVDAKEGAGELLARAGQEARDESLRVRAIDGAGQLASTKEHFDRLAGWAKNKEVRVAAAGVRGASRLAELSDARKELLSVLDTALDRRADKKFYFAYVAAIEGLGRLDAPEARARLVSELIALPDDDQHPQERIARALAAQAAAQPAGVAESVRGGFALAKKPEELRRVARLCGRLRLADALTDLEALLGHADERVRSESARAVGLLGKQSSAPALIKLLDDVKSPYARLEAVTALARCLSAEDFRALGSRIAKDPGEMHRVQFVVEIADRMQPAGIEALKPFLGDASWRVSSAAAATVGTLGVGDDLPLLLPLATHRDWRIRAAAFEGMGRLRAVAAIPKLAEGLADKDPVVRGVCHANLQILTAEQLPADPATWRKWFEAKGGALNLIKKSRRDAAEKPKEDRYARTKEYAIEVLQRARILVVTGAWDKVEKVLAHLAIPHTALRAQQLKEVGLNPNQIVLVNCEGNVDKDSQERLRWFVNVGGSFMSTDWALTKAVKECFPGYVQQFSGSSTGNDVVVVEEATPGHRYTRGIFDNVPALQWWLEIQAFPMTVTYPERCEVIVDSAEMRQRYGSSPMACTFRWGLGHVQHSLSHFYLQEEGMQKQSDERSRMIFAADNLGLSLDQIRRIAKDKGFDGQINEETMKKIAPDYSMFRLIVNVVREKTDWVENL
ncbi:MAG: hypothetical protein HMLKMBBP_00764 [Planctomycetes bacterium]|nr:hypothetical protein [Planctomycetota bacterium]